MTAQRDPDRLILAFLEEGQTMLPYQVFDAVRDEVERTRQRPAILPWRVPDMNRIVGAGLAAVVVVVAAFIGLQLLGGRSPNAGGPTPTATPVPSVAASPVPTPDGFPSGAIPAGTYHLSGSGVENQPLTLTIASDRWEASYSGSITTGSPGAPDSAWVIFLTRLPHVSVDPCAGTATPVTTVDGAVTALTAVAGTDAVGPIDASVGGTPAKLVELTIHGDFACPRDAFWLYGDGSFYPGAQDSVIRDWVLERNGQVYFVHADQVGTDTALAGEIQQIVDSIQFD